MKNVMGIDSFELSPGKFTHIKAPNGIGKTSIANGLSDLFNGGASAARILRNGSDEGEEILEINDGEYSFQKTFTEYKTTFKARENGKISKAPVDLLQSLINKRSANPISFFTATKEERKEILLKAMPIKCDPIRMKEITGMEGSFEGVAFDVIKSSRDLIYKDRTLTNSAAKERRNTAFQVAQTLPELESVAIDTTELEEQKKSFETIKDEKLKAIDVKLAGLESNHLITMDDIKTSFDLSGKVITDKIRQLEKEFQENETERKSKEFEAKTKIEGLRSLASTAKESRNSEYKLAVSEIDSKLRESRIAIENEGRLKQSRDLIVQKTQEAEELEETSEKMTKAINYLDAYKIELMASLPIEGLELVGDLIKYNGVEWDFINEAKRMDLAFEIAMLQCGKVPFIFVDGAERLDAKNFELFKSKAMSSKAQCIVFSVDHDANSTGITSEVF
jgi:hypothetical protein